MCGREDNLDPKNIKRDYSREIIVFAGQEYPL